MNIYKLFIIITFEILVTFCFCLKDKVQKRILGITSGNWFKIFDILPHVQNFNEYAAYAEYNAIVN